MRYRYEDILGCQNKPLATQIFPIIFFSLQHGMCVSLVVGTKMGVAKTGTSITRNGCDAAATTKPFSSCRPDFICICLPPPDPVCTATLCALCRKRASYLLTSTIYTQLCVNTSGFNPLYSALTTRSVHLRSILPSWPYSFQAEMRSWHVNEAFSASQMMLTSA